MSDLIAIAYADAAGSVLGGRSAYITTTLGEPIASQRHPALGAAKPAS